ncbi:ABC transporter substrate-binding protein [Aquibacillus salsiterrae]|uniref:Sugar ABC transporter substrate-binding protein n=1 Tax=Aquibacillus salsiterrae TaxID=2950439 RepID=A0A9X4AFG9_9BACI|nr:sugar ABC transporter substrate-binding protein [Aquibacillus salsiterrae]MDC3416018.1 sugar ABC transporter substrate-binding protein [Aquibacillus salsiterrae]
MKKQLSRWMLMLVMLVVMGAIVACSSSEEAGSDQGATDNSTDNAENSESDSSDSDGEKVELRMMWWGSQDRHDRTLKVIDLYEEQNPNVTINPEFTGWDGYWQKVATQAAGGNLPDILQMDYAYLSEYAGKELLANLNPFLDSGILDLSDSDDVYIDGGKIDGNLYAVNIGANVFAAAYDPTLFEKAGVEPPKPGYTYEDMKAAAQQISDNLDGVYGLQPDVGIATFNIFARQFGGSIYNEEGTGLNYDDEQLINFLQQTVDMLDSGAAAPPDVFMDAGSNIEQQPIVNEQTAMLLAIWSNQLVALESAAGRPLELTLQPLVEGGEKGHFLKPGQFLSVTTDSKQQEEAAKFIDFFTNSVEANKILNAERGVPIAAKVREALKENLDEAGIKMFEYVEMAQEYSKKVDPPNPPGSSEVEKVWETEVEQPIYYGEVTPEEAAKVFREKAEEILAKNK